MEVLQQCQYRRGKWIKCVSSPASHAFIAAVRRTCAC